MISLLIGFFMLSFFISKGGNSLASLAAAWAMALIWLSARIGVGVGEVDDLTDCLSVCKNTQNCTRLGHPHLLLSILLSTLYQEQIKFLHWRLIDDLVDMSYLLLLLRWNLRYMLTD